MLFCISSLIVLPLYIAYSDAYFEQLRLVSFYCFHIYLYWAAFLAIEVHWYLVMFIAFVIQYNGCKHTVSCLEHWASVSQHEVRIQCLTLSKQFHVHSLQCLRLCYYLALCLQVFVEVKVDSKWPCLFLLSELKMPCVGNLDCSCTEPVEVLPKFLVERLNSCPNVML